jgi:hypothetical protein
MRRRITATYAYRLSKAGGNATVDVAGRRCIACRRAESPIASQN